MARPILYPAVEELIKQKKNISNNKNTEIKVVQITMIPAAAEEKVSLGKAVKLDPIYLLFIILFLGGNKARQGFI